MSSYGGMDRAVRALCRRGLVDYQGMVVTEEGRKVYDARVEAAKQIEATRQARAQMEEGYADERRARRRVRE